MGCISINIGKHDTDFYITPSLLCQQRTLSPPDIWSWYISTCLFRTSILCSYIETSLFTFADMECGDIFLSRGSVQYNYSFSPTLQIFRSHSPRLSQDATQRRRREVRHKVDSNTFNTGVPPSVKKGFVKKPSGRKHTLPVLAQALRRSKVYSSGMWSYFIPIAEISITVEVVLPEMRVWPII